MTRISPRCTQCLKFQADDPSKIGEDEVEKLLSCSACKKVKYYSRNCQKINYQFHKSHCKYLKLIGTSELPWGRMESKCQWNWADMQLRKIMSLYATAIMGQDYGLCEEFLEFVIKIRKLWNSFDKQVRENSNLDDVNGQTFLEKDMDFLCISVLLTLGRDQEVYDFMKLQHCWFCPDHWNDNSTSYEKFKNMPKNEGDQNKCKENFSKQNFFQWFSEKQNRMKNILWVTIISEATAVILKFVTPAIVYIFW